MLRDVEAVKIEQAARYFAMFGGVVAHGPFSGFRMQQTQYWSHYDATAKLFGLYEKEVADRLVALSASHDTFIDIGAADGYFGVAAVCCGHFRQSVCFEISPTGRQSIRHAAELNGVADRVDIRGEADAAELKNVIDRCPGPAAVLIDIEGAEFASIQPADSTALEQTYQSANVEAFRCTYCAANVFTYSSADVCTIRKTYWAAYNAAISTANRATYFSSYCATHY